MLQEGDSILLRILIQITIFIVQRVCSVFCVLFAIDISSDFLNANDLVYMVGLNL